MRESATASIELEEERKFRKQRFAIDRLALVEKSHTLHDSHSSPEAVSCSREMRNFPSETSRFFEGWFSHLTSIRLIYANPRTERICKLFNQSVRVRSLLTALSLL